jgi:hypothetical protein
MFILFPCLKNIYLYLALAGVFLGGGQCSELDPELLAHKAPLFYSPVLLLIFGLFESFSKTPID